MNKKGDVAEQKLRDYFKYEPTGLEEKLNDVKYEFLFWRNEYLVVSEKLSFLGEYNHTFTSYNKRKNFVRDKYECSKVKYITLLESTYKDDIRGDYWRVTVESQTKKVTPK